jgi:hypothetical protein
VGGHQLMKRFSIVGLTTNIKGGRCPDMSGSYVVIQYLSNRAALVKHLVPDGTPADSTTLADETADGKGILPAVGTAVDLALASQMRSALTTDGIAGKDIDTVLADRGQLLLLACQRLWNRPDLTIERLLKAYDMRRAHGESIR